MRRACVPLESVVAGQAPPEPGGGAEEGPFSVVSEVAGQAPPEPGGDGEEGLVPVESVVAGQAPPEPGGGGDEGPCSTCVRNSRAGSP